MSEHSDNVAALQRRKNYQLLWVLCGVVALLFGMSIVKFSGVMKAEEAAPAATTVAP